MTSRTRRAVLPRVGAVDSGPRTVPERESTRTRRGPGDMASEGRLAELGALLAMGYRRLQLRQKALAESADPEALCGQAVDGNGAESAEEAE